jgi:hypothetical protein
MDPCEISRQAINQIAKGIWGSKSELTNLEDLNAGFAKKTYRLTFKAPSLQCILHIWARPNHLIHGECSPEHILINQAEAVYFIDYEGLKFFDLEFEHSLLKVITGYALF